MKFAHFSHVWGKDGMTPHQRYEQLWRELQLCDALGFDASYCVEHHFRPDESWMSAPSLYAVAAGARTKRMRVGVMGYVVPLYHPLRLAEEIAVVDQMLGGRFDVGLVSGIIPDYFGPYGVDFADRKKPTLEFVSYLRAAFGPQPFSFQGERFTADNVTLAAPPLQRPTPRLWMQSRDPATLELCAREGLNTGYFFNLPRTRAAPIYREFLGKWAAAGHKRKPQIAYSTLVYVDETDAKARDTALKEAGRAYLGFTAAPKPGDTAESRIAEWVTHFASDGPLGEGEIMRNMFDPEWMLEHDLMFIGSPDTVAAKLRKAAGEGLFSDFLGEFNFAELGEADVMRSIRLFGEAVIPQLKNFEPF